MLSTILLLILVTAVAAFWLHHSRKLAQIKLAVDQCLEALEAFVTAIEHAEPNIGTVFEDRVHAVEADLDNILGRNKPQ